MAFTHINSINAAGHADTVTSGNIDTTGAKIICISVSWYSAGVAPTITDSASNTWIQLTPQVGAINIVLSAIYYCINPSTSSTHNFTTTASASFSSISVSAFNCTATPIFDVENSSNVFSTNTSVSCSITPTYNNSLIFTSCVTWQGTSPITVNSSFNIGTSNDFASGLQFMNANGYLIQTTASMVTPEFTWANYTVDEAQTIASFYFVASSNKNKMFFNL